MKNVELTCEEADFMCQVLFPHQKIKLSGENVQFALGNDFLFTCSHVVHMWQSRLLLTMWNPHVENVISTREQANVWLSLMQIITFVFIFVLHSILANLDLKRQDYPLPPPLRKGLRLCSFWLYVCRYTHHPYLYYVVFTGDLHSFLTELQRSEDRVTSPAD